MRLACHSGEQDLREELKELEVKFGEMRGEDGSRFAAFGTETEVVSLRKGAVL